MADGQEQGGSDSAANLQTFQGTGNAPNLSTTQEVVPSAPRPRRTGRPTKFNAERAERFLTAYARGCSVSVAASAAGVSKGCVLGWLARGRQACSGRLHDFATAFSVARSRAEAELVDVAYEAALVKRDAKIALAILERRHPQRWRRRTAIAVTTPKPLAVDWSRFASVREAYRWANDAATIEERIARSRAIVDEDEKVLAEARRELLAGNGQRDERP